MKMHYCTAKINLSGQGFTIIDVPAAAPISWPEVQVLMALHGDENVTDIKPISVAENISAYGEKARLGAKYGKIIDQVFPGRSPQMEMLMPGEAEDQQTVSDDGLDKVAAQDDGEETQSREPPPGIPTFGPGRVARPRPGSLPGPQGA